MKGHTKSFMNGNLIEGCIPISITIYSAKLTMSGDRGLELVPQKTQFQVGKTTNCHEPQNTGHRSRVSSDARVFIINTNKAG